MLITRTNLYCVAVIGFLTLLSLALVSQVNADEPDSTSTTYPSRGTQQFKRQLAGGRVIHSSPIFADVNGDGKDEILVGTTSLQRDSAIRPSFIGAYDSTTGAPLWETNTDAPVNAALVVADIDGRGDLEVIAAVGGEINDMAHQGGVFVYNARTGENIWKWYSRDDFPDGLHGDGYKDGVFATPAVGDVDNDGDMEIAFGSWDRWIYMLDHEGYVVWEYNNGDTIFSSAAMADLNGDGYLEIITGADISGDNPGGFLYAFDRNGMILFRNHVVGAIYSSPSIGDLDSDGDLEIVVGMQSASNGSSLLGKVYMWDHTGALVPGWPQDTSIAIGVSSPALADINNDGDLEIFIGAGDGRLYAWHHTGQTLAGWPTAPFSYIVHSSPTIGDYDGDGALEVLIAHGWAVFALDARGQIESAWDSGYTIVGSPAVGDPDKDGRVEVVIGGSHHSDEAHGYLYSWETGRVNGGFPWPMFKQNAQGTSLYPEAPRLHLNLEDAFVLHDTVRDGHAVNTATTTMTLRNGGGGVINWAAAAENSRVSIAPASGSLGSGREAVLTLTIDTRNLAAGTHDLGGIVLTAKGANNSSAAAPVSIPVTVKLGDFQQVYLPLVRRR